MRKHIQRPPFLHRRCRPWSVSGISSRFQLLSQSPGQIIHALLTRPPLTLHPSIRKLPNEGPFDLHVLSTPPAFVLSQDQTLQRISLCVSAAFFFFKSILALFYFQRLLNNQQDIRFFGLFVFHCSVLKDPTARLSANSFILALPLPLVKDFLSPFSGGALSILPVLFRFVKAFFPSSSAQKTAARPRRACSVYPISPPLSRTFSSPFFPFGGSNSLCHHILYRQRIFPQRTTRYPAEKLFRPDFLLYNIAVRRGRFSLPAGRRSSPPFLSYDAAPLPAPFPPPCSRLPSLPAA